MLTISYRLGNISLWLFSKENNRLNKEDVSLDRVCFTGVLPFRNVLVPALRTFSSPEIFNGIYGGTVHTRVNL